MVSYVELSLFSKPQKRKKAFFVVFCAFSSCQLVDVLVVVFFVSCFCFESSAVLCCVVL